MIYLSAVLALAAGGVFFWSSLYDKNCEKGFIVLAATFAWLPLVDLMMTVFGWDISFRKAIYPAAGLVAGLLILRGNKNSIAKRKTLTDGE